MTTLHFVRRRKADFWIADEDGENQNPTVRCQEDVDAANAEDDRDMFVILEEKRQPYFGDTTLKRVDMAFLKAWWLESARLELRRDPDTGEIRDEPIQVLGITLLSQRVLAAHNGIGVVVHELWRLVSRQSSYLDCNTRFHPL